MPTGDVFDILLAKQRGEGEHLVRGVERLPEDDEGPIETSELPQRPIMVQMPEPIYMGAQMVGWRDADGEHIADNEVTRAAREGYG